PGPFISPTLLFLLAEVDKIYPNQKGTVLGISGILSFKNSKLITIVISFQRKRRPTFVVLRNFVLYISYDATHRNLFADIILKIFELSQRRITEIFELVFLFVKHITYYINNKQIHTA